MIESVTDASSGSRRKASLERLGDRAFWDDNQATEQAMRLVKVSFTPDTCVGRDICDAIDKAQGSELLQEALKNHLQAAMRAGLAQARKSVEGGA